MKKLIIPNKTVTAKADPRLDHAMAKNLWKSFTLLGSELEIAEGSPLTFVIGDTPLPCLDADSEYTLCVTETGAAVVGKDYGGLMRGFLVLLMKMEFDGE